MLLQNRMDYLIGKVTELDEEPSILIEGCMKIEDGKLEPFPKYSKQRDLFLTSDSVLTIVDPSTEILGEYQKEDE